MTPDGGRDQAAADDAERAIGASRERPEANGRRKAAAFWEWAIGAVGALLVCATVGYLVHHGLQPSMPASIAIDSGIVAEQPDGFLLPFTVSNHGSEAVSGLRIVAEQRGADGSVAVVAESTIDHLPGGSSRSGGLLFAMDPRARPVSIRAVGYADP